jgi:hypothetical protein
MAPVKTNTENWNTALLRLRTLLNKGKILKIFLYKY